MSKTTWMIASTALHGAALWLALSIIPGTRRPAAAVHQDVFASSVWVAVEVAAPPAVLAPAAPPLQPLALPAVPAPPTEPAKTRLPQASPAAPAEPAGPVAQTRPVRPKPVTPRGPRHTQAKNAAAPTGEHAPKPTSAALEAEDDWLGLSGSVDEAPAPPRSEPADPLVERLYAAERRKAAAREAARSTASAPSADQGDPEPPERSSPPPTHVRDLAGAVTRAIPYATQSDPAWERLELGLVGRFELTLQLKDGELLAGEAADRPVPAPLWRLERNTRILLRSGRFALASAGSKKRSGRQRLEITVRLSERPRRDAVAIGFRAPTTLRPGNGYFVLPSGRRFDAIVKLKN